MICEGPIDLSILDLYCPVTTYGKLDRYTLYRYYKSGIIIRENNGTDNATLVLTDCRKDDFCEWRVSVKVNNEWNHQYLYFNSEIERVSVLDVMVYFKYTDAINYQRIQKIDSLLA